MPPAPIVPETSPAPPPVVVPASEEVSQDGKSATPRQSGSMVSIHQDDVVTRMKNIEMIELGRHRIKPWYFSPYPQVNIYYA